MLKLLRHPRKSKKEDGTTIEAVGAPSDSSSSQKPALNPNTLRLTSNSPTLPREKVGLFELSNSREAKTVDVIAVHGLQGDAYRTWEHENGSLWLRDFLPADIPSARIMTFGYDSAVAFSKSVAKLEDKALELLNRLTRQRSPAPDGSSKPIVFICHSLEGIIVKKALILAHERSSDTDYKDILDNTKAIAFLGVPHRGSDSAWWASFAADVVKAASMGTSTNTGLVKELKKNSDTLMVISKQFVHRTIGLRIYTFYETRKLFGAVVC